MGFPYALTNILKPLVCLTGAGFDRGRGLTGGGVRPGGGLS